MPSTASHREVTYGGKSEAFARLRGIVVTEIEFPPHAQLVPHFHDHLCVSYVLDGSFVELTPSARFECSAGSLIVRPPGLLHEDRGGERGAHCLSLELEPARLAELGPCARAFEIATHTDGSSLGALAARLRFELHASDDAGAVALEGLCLELLAAASRLSLGPLGASAPLWLERALAVLAQRLTENVPIDELAAEIGVAPARLSRLFRTKFGCSISEYVRQLRVAHACRMLRESDIPLAEIASASGFYDQSHFTRVFRRQTAMTPNEYRRASAAQH